MGVATLFILTRKRYQKYGFLKLSFPLKNYYENPTNSRRHQKKFVANTFQI
jgi:glutathione peroxidase-family protein